MRTGIPNRIVCLSHGGSSGPRNLSTPTSTEVAKPSTSTTSANSAAVLLSTLPGRKLRIALTSALGSVSSFGDSWSDDASPIAPSRELPEESTPTCSRPDVRPVVASTRPDPCAFRPRRRRVEPLWDGAECPRARGKSMCPKIQAKRPHLSPRNNDRETQYTQNEARRHRGLAQTKTTPARGVAQ